MNRCDPLLAGLPLDPDCPLPCCFSSPSPSNSCLPVNAKCDKHWGPVSDQALDCTTHWPRTPEQETVAPPASEDVEKDEGWRLPWGPGPAPFGAVPFPSQDLQKGRCHEHEFFRKQHNKKALETSSCKVKVKSTAMIADSHKFLRCELESLKSQLQAQTKAFEFLNHSVTMLEKESCLQQIKIQQLEGEKEGPKWGAEQGRQELYGALAQGLQGLQKTLRDNEEVQRARTTRCLQLLAQEIRDSKKFLWEELELVREEVTFIYQKLQAQEDEISQNLVNIQKMQKTQVKCRKVLTKMKQQGYEALAWNESDEAAPGGSCWKDDLQKELSDIWSAVHGLQNSMDGFTMSTGARPMASSLRGHKGHRCLSPQLPSWDSDSDSDQQPFNRRRSFPPA